jgi:general secretion pathway protein E
MSALVLTEDHIAAARTHMLAAGGSWSAALAQATGGSADQVTAALARRFACVAMPLDQAQALTPWFQVLSFTECVQRAVMLGRDAQDQLWLLMANPFDGEAEDWAMRQARQHGACPKLAVVHADDLQACLTLQERQLRAIDGLSPELSATQEEDVAAVISLASINDESSPVIRLVNSTLHDALKLKASDIHLECDAGCLHVLYRMDGVLVPITQVQGQETAEQVISRVKVMADLDIAERRVPQDGRFRVRINGRDVDFRVSIMPNIFGEDAVLRLLDRQQLTDEAQALTLERLGLAPAVIRQVRRLATKPHGMLLVTGPTGSGKTTTLYAAITEIHTGRDKIVTIEDPVEYRLPRVLQIPVNEKKGLTFARGLRSILRHDPDKIMVGEIRDGETAQIAVQSALTGHLVFTSVHANSVFDVLGRFLHMGVDAYSLASALNGVVAQRLVRINCPHCREAIQPEPQALEDLGLTEADVQGWHWAAGRGCAHCRGAGYQGRKAIAEVLVLDDELRECIANKGSVAHMKTLAAKAGWAPIRSQALDLVAAGETTLDEVLRVTG